MQDLRNLLQSINLNREEALGIDKDKSLPADAAELRRHAEERLQVREKAELHPPRTEEATQRLVHELEVHQIELEMQNAELHQARDARDVVETALDKYTDLYDFAPVGYFTLDRNGAIRALNLSGASLLGIERAKLIGRQFTRFVADEARSLFSVFLGKVFASHGKESCEVTLKKEGKHPLFAQIEAVAVASGQGCRIAIIDISVRKQLETEIQDAREYAENIVETVREPLVVLNSDLKILTANQSFYNTFKVTPEATIGNFIYDLGNRQWAIPKLRVLFEDILPHGTVFNGYEVEHDFPGIGRKIILLNARQIYRENIGSRIILLAMEDITERKQLEEKLEIMHTELADRSAELEAANIELEAFNYSVSHDLRSPLTAINAYCQVIQRLYDNSLDEECKGYIQEMYEGTLRMNRLIDTLLNFSRVTRVEMRHDKVDLSKMAEVIALGLKVSEPESLVTFRIASGITADGDSGLLRVVLDNLIGNAWKYTDKREGAVIEFGVTEVDGKPACFVRDNGPGFDMAFADKLFIPFQRLPGTNVEGNGIGLATVDRIVRRHGGRIWAEGEQGKGATFYFTLEYIPIF
jgi:PAS domain S-box-containing protein